MRQGARLGVAGRGEAGPGKAGRGARLSKAGHGAAGQGMARQGFLGKNGNCPFFSFPLIPS